MTTTDEKRTGDGSSPESSPDDRTTPAADGAASPGPATDKPPHRLEAARRRVLDESPRASLALLGLLVATGVLYFWNLSANGYANSFYSAAVQAGSQSWKAFFYGSSDAANSITVDKPPASLWLMALSVRLFGLNTIAILLPQVLMGIGTVLLVDRTVKRYFGVGAGLVAGAAMAITPVAVLMFRFNNPDALLVMLMALGAWATLRAIEKGSIRWMALVGVFIGFGFLTKTLQAFLVVPFFGLAFMLFAATTWRRRVLGLLAAVGALVVAGGWWVAIVELVPESWRPFIGGSQNDSFLELTFGYNGLGRINGEETGSVGGGGPSSGETGLARLFSSDLGGQISWLIPAALILVVLALWMGRRAPRTDMRRASHMVWGGWFLATFLTFSFMAGIFHQYYTVALSPAIAVMVGAGAGELWQRRSTWLARIGLALAALATGVWGFVLLQRQTEYGQWLAILVLATGILAALGVLFAHRMGRALLAALLASAIVSAGAGQAAYAVSTVTTAKTGSIITAGPTVSSGMGGGPGGMGGGPGGQGGGQGFPGGQGQTGQTGQGQTGQGTTGQSQNGQNQTGQGGMGTPPGQSSQSQQGQSSQGQQSQQGQMPSAGGAEGAMGGGPGGGGGGGMSGLLDATEPDQDVVDALTADADQYTWVAAAVGSQSAAGMQLASEEPVMAIGGFNGSDPSPTLEQFQQYVEDGQIHYLLASSGFGQQNGGSDSASEIVEWASENYKEVTIGDSTFYDLTQPVSSSTSTQEAS
ncbi:glycosyltransferase family 39 protein [Brachybacterium kimchii]|uniref:Glycosyltransferase family 39 protein n=1 Tax=Brachybacterium kimchii TaxID=2942909 RepID=A0ABY4N1E4_9MICO|nr:glycosyltransferase family 39 protein [Brachybacterium kimchii]UQN28367.1 glycosyltransferase family 39 protein [Brachybacterium kimchii]